jgi:hypothetical protein
MPLERKINEIGNCRTVSLPVSWVRNAEQQAGAKMIKVAMECNHKITIEPIFAPIEQLKPEKETLAEKIKNKLHYEKEVKLY